MDEPWALLESQGQTYAALCCRLLVRRGRAASLPHPAGLPPQTFHLLHQSLRTSRDPDRLTTTTQELEPWTQSHLCGFGSSIWFIACFEVPGAALECKLRQLRFRTSPCHGFCQLCIFKREPPSPPPPRLLPFSRLALCGFTQTL